LNRFRVKQVALEGSVPDFLAWLPQGVKRRERQDETRSQHEGLWAATT
jgi:hypothetical protein